MKTTIKLTFCIFALIMSVFSISAASITITSGTFHSSGSNTSLSVSTPINASNVVISSDSIYLQNFQFNQSKAFWINESTFINNSDTYDFNFTLENILVDTADMIDNFRFYDLTFGTYLENFKFGNFTAAGQYLSVFFNYFTPENYTWLFEKSGYEHGNYSFSTNYFSYNNVTFNVSATGMSIKVYDETDPTTQLYFNVTIDNGINETIYLNQFNFTKYYNETLTGNLSVTIESSGYAKRKIFTEFTPFTSTSHTIYLLNQNDSTPVIFQTLNTAKTQPIEDVVLNFYKVINGTTTFLAQAKTDSQGYTYFNMDILEDYEIVISKSGYVMQTMNSIPGKIEYVILMEEDAVNNDWLFQDFAYKITPRSSIINSLSQDMGATVIDSANLITRMTVTVSGENFSYSNTSNNANGGIINFNISEVSPQYTINLTVIREGESYSWVKKVNYINETNSTISVQKVGEQLEGEENNADRVMMMIFIYIIAIVFGSMFSPSIGAIVGLLPITIFIFVGWLGIGFGAIFYLLTIFGVMYFER